MKFVGLLRVSTPLCVALMLVAALPSFVEAQQASGSNAPLGVSGPAAATASGSGSAPGAPVSVSGATQGAPGAAVTAPSAAQGAPAAAVTVPSAAESAPAQAGQAPVAVEGVQAPAASQPIVVERAPAPAAQRGPLPLQLPRTGIPDAEMERGGPNLFVALGVAALGLFMLRARALREVVRRRGR